MTVRRWQVQFVKAVIVGVAAVAATTLVITRQEAHRLLTSPADDRPIPHQTPASYGLAYQDVDVTTADGLTLVGWLIPGTNGSLVLAQHGYKAHRGLLLEEAEMLRRHGYGVLVTSVRGHDRSDGDRITFGVAEMQDLDAWFRLALELPGVESGRIGMLGNSMGGSLVIQYAASQPLVRAVVAHSAFSSLDDTIDTSIEFLTGLPAFPFAPLITFWAEREAGFDASAIDATRWIGQLSPRPILLLQGGADRVISIESGQRLYDAAGEPKDLWFEPDIGHTAFDRSRPAEFERRVVTFFDQYLGADSERRLPG